MESGKEHLVDLKAILGSKEVDLSGQSQSERPQDHGFLRPAFGPLNDSGMIDAIAYVEAGKRISPETMEIFKGTPIGKTLHKFVAPQK